MSKPHSLVTAAPLSTQMIYCGLLPNFETWQKAKKQDRLSCKRLSKGDAEHKELAAVYSRCRKSDRCGSCKKCLKRARQSLIPQAAWHLLRLLKKRQREAKEKGAAMPKLWAVSAADARQAVPRDSLSVAAVTTKTETLSKAIERSVLKYAVVFGGVDFSLNFLRPTGSDPVWQPHYYLLIVTPSDTIVHSVLDKHFSPAVGTRSVPVRIDEVDPKDLPTCVSYCLKAEFTRRESYKGRNGRIQTAKNSLKANERDELAVFLHKLGIGNRLLLRGLKITKGKVTRTALCPQHTLVKKAKIVTWSVQDGRPGLFDTTG